MGSQYYFWLTVLVALPAGYIGGLVAVVLHRRIEGNLP